MKLGIVGNGRLGSALKASLNAIDLDVHVFNREHWADVQRHEACFPDLDVWIVCVPDDAALAVIRELAVKRPAARLVCTSGGLEMAEMYLAWGAAAGIAKLHPLQSFAKREQRVFESNTHFALGGDTELCELLESWVTNWRGVAHRLGDDQWLLYHLAATLSANFLPLLIRRGSELLQSLDNSQTNALSWLRPLVEQSVAFGLDAQLDAPYSGVAIRGDTQMINRHADLLASIDPAWRETYLQLCQRMSDRRLN